MKNGINVVNDLLEEDCSFLSPEEFKQKYNIQTNLSLEKDVFNKNGKMQKINTNGKITQRCLLPIVPCYGVICKLNVSLL